MAATDLYTPFVFTTVEAAQRAADQAFADGEQQLANIEGNPYGGNEYRTQMFTASAAYYARAAAINARIQTELAYPTPKPVDMAAPAEAIEPLASSLLDPR